MIAQHQTLRHGLVAAWCPSLRQGGYVLPDVSPCRMNGTLVGATSWSQGVLACDGSTGRVSVPYHPNQETTGGASWTLAAWVYPRSASATSCILNRGTTASYVRDYLFYFTSTGFAIQNADGTNFPTITGGSAPTLNRWVHVAATCSSTGAAVLYVGGVQVGSGTLRTNLSASTSRVVSIGADTELGGNFFFANALFDDVRIYNRPLTPAGIGLLATRPGIGLVPQRQRRFYPRKMWVNVAGTWKNADTYQNVGGEWKVTVPYTRVSGEWK
jgi:hypothetical protein